MPSPRDGDGHTAARSGAASGGAHRHRGHQADLRPLLALGIVAFASSLDQAGPITKTVRDAAIMLSTMASYDPKDTTSVEAPVPDYEAALGKGVKGLRIGVPKEYRVDGMSKEIEALWTQGIEWLKAAGATIHEISLPHTKYALPAYYIVAPAEASSNLARYDGVRYGLRVPGRDVIDTYENTRAASDLGGGGAPAHPDRNLRASPPDITTPIISKAQKVRTLIKRDFDEAWNKVDVVLTPTTPSPAFAFGEKTGDPLAMYLEDIFTVTVNMAGLPGMSVPAGLSSEGTPLGLQLIGKPLRRGDTCSASVRSSRMPPAASPCPSDGGREPQRQPRAAAQPRQEEVRRANDGSEAPVGMRRHVASARRDRPHRRGDGRLDRRALRLCGAGLAA